MSRQILEEYGPVICEKMLSPTRWIRVTFSEVKEGDFLRFLYPNQPDYIAVDGKNIFKATKDGDIQTVQCDNTLYCSEDF